MTDQNTNSEKVLENFISNLEKLGKKPTSITIINDRAFIEVGMNISKITKGYIFDMRNAQIAEGKWESDGTIHQSKKLNN